MEPAQAKPLRRRLRWLIIAFVLVLLSAISWWHWPRGDARFVGRWKAHIENRSKSSDYVLDLRSGGLARMTWEDGGSTFTSWTVRDGCLVFGGIPDGLISRLLVDAAKRFSSKTTRFRFGTESIYEIGDVSTNCVVSTACLASSRGAMKRLEMRTIFTRIPE
jgi:hypothetical protein